MKKSSHIRVMDLSKNETSTFTKPQLYLAVAFIYIYLLTAIFF
ncbi:hypothetical protein [Christiangramia sabulilitoris]|nr:hypothetical protein [Christiangramia sabulilitoris]